MSRRMHGIVAAVLALGYFAAMLPAQESSRRTASKYRFDMPGATNSRPNLSPPVGDPEFGDSRVQTTSNAAATPGQYGPAKSGAPGQFPGGSYPAPDQLSPADNSPAELEDGRLRSILKRPKASAPEEGPPATLPPTRPHRRQRIRRSAPRCCVASKVVRTAMGLFAGYGCIATGSVAYDVSSGSGCFGQQSERRVLRVEINGPQGVTVGKPAAYTVTLNNDSDATADEVQVRLTLPSFVTVQAAQPTYGEAGGQGELGRLLWNLPRVAGRAKEQLKLQIVTKEADSFELGAEWTAKATATRAAIVVKQAQVALALAGPADMTFGEEKTFTLTVSNPGTGDAERVLVTVASGNAPPQQFDAGMIPAGHKKEVPLAVVASQTGSIDLQISAAADAGLETRTSHRITVRKADVSLAIEGPPLKYAGSEAIYHLAVTNSGSATADNVNLSLTLPPGAKYVGGIDGAANAGGGVRWKIASLSTGRAAGIRGAIAVGDGGHEPRRGTFCRRRRAERRIAWPRQKLKPFPT